jgi:hypothetical protein
MVKEGRSGPRRRINQATGVLLSFPRLYLVGVNGGGVATIHQFLAGEFEGA